MSEASSRELAERAGAALSALRKKAPRVHCLTNTVVQKFTADGLSALGAVPSMTDSPDEIAAFAGYADALLVNLGTLNASLRDVIALGAEVVAKAGKPIVLDPVFCDVSPVRLGFARQLIDEYQPLLRANTREIAVLEPSADLTVVQTGAMDVARRGDHAVGVHNGHPWMAVVVGTGCLSGALIGAFRAVEPDPVIAAASALAVFGVAAEIAVLNSPGPGTFGVALLDALHAVTPQDVERRARMDLLPESVLAS